jgi:hypothetical protein
MKGTRSNDEAAGNPIFTNDICSLSWRYGCELGGSEKWCRRGEGSCCCWMFRFVVFLLLLFLFRFCFCLFFLKKTFSFFSKGCSCRAGCGNCDCVRFERRWNCLQFAVVDFFGFGGVLVERLQLASRRISRWRSRRVRLVQMAAAGRNVGRRVAVVVKFGQQPCVYAHLGAERVQNCVQILRTSSAGGLDLGCMGFCFISPPFFCRIPCITECLRRLVSRFWERIWGF